MIVESQPKMQRSRGDLIVQLWCQGHRELIHELCHPDWLGQLNIEAPSTLRDEFDDYVNQSRRVTV